MILLIGIGIVAAILLTSILEGALRAAAIVFLGCIIFVFTCDFFNVDWHPLVASQRREATAVARHVVRAREREIREWM